MNGGAVHKKTAANEDRERAMPLDYLLTKT
jgi:hypothetical protein